MKDLASHVAPATPRFLICRPQHFAVTYSINPWMDPNAWAGNGEVLHARAVRQWEGLHRTLRACGAAIETVEPPPGLPDLVFTANAAVVLDRKAVLARFLHPERQREEPVPRPFARSRPAACSMKSLNCRPV
jgi:N-dimethylarginine dimethylaminohydrolase